MANHDGKQKIPNQPQLATSKTQTILVGITGVSSLMQCGPHAAGALKTLSKPTQ